MPSPPLGITASQDHFSASGGTVTSAGGYTIHTFTASGTFTIGAKGKREIEWEIIGGGGAGQPGAIAKYAKAGGGGGAGGYMTGTQQLSPHYNDSTTSPVTNIPVTIGAGGAASGGLNPGNPSSFKRMGAGVSVPEFTAGGTKTGANGGGCAGSPTNDWGVYEGFSGSSGGASCGINATGVNSPYSPNGNSGGDTNGNINSGGGGGAGGAGGAGANNQAGAGGSGISGVCGGGGGGAFASGNGGSASSGGGGGGTPTGQGTSGTVNTGGGGGGGGGFADSNQSIDILGGNGGSGKIIIKYKTV